MDHTVDPKFHKNFTLPFVIHEKQFISGIFMVFFAFLVIFSNTKG